MPDGPMSDWLRARDAQDAQPATNEWLTFGVGGKVALGALGGVLVCLGLGQFTTDPIDMYAYMGCAVAGGLIGLQFSAK